MESSTTSKEFTIPIKRKGKNVLVTTSQVSYLEAHDNYCFVHYKDGSQDILSKCLKHVLVLLGSDSFLKTHRKYAVNSSFVKSLDMSRSVLFLQDGSEVLVSRSNRKKITHWFTNKNRISFN